VRDEDGGPERGRSRRRLEDKRFLTGLGRYVDDLPESSHLFGQVLRSPVAHGRIADLDVSAATRMVGVEGVFTSADLEADGIGPLPCRVQIEALSPLVVPPRPALAAGRVRHVGDPVAFVVASTAAAARDAAEAIVVEYDDLPPVTDASLALDDGAPLVWDEAPGNLAFRFQKGNREAVENAFMSASAVVELTLENNRVAVAPLEPRAAIAHYDELDQTYELILSGQGVHDMRRQLAEDVFRVHADRVHLVAPMSAAASGPRTSFTRNTSSSSGRPRSLASRSNGSRIAARTF
jgi:carbon-monoxide dehydrogenase large subunit